ncbi:MAG TPA: ribonuclease J [Actinomycetota bacterium]
MTPSPTASTDPRLVFLGGVGEIGRNMAALEMQGRILLIDAGLSFPEAEMPGIDLVLPDFQYLRERRDQLEAVVLTHGHEDHVGSLPYLLREFELPVYATRLTLALLEGKLEEHGVREHATFHPTEPGQEVRAGPFAVRLYRVSHSIPDGVALAVDLPAGTLLHTGDFKLDPSPIDGRVTDLQGIAAEARRGIHVLLSDSTNAEDPGTTGSERTVGPVLYDIIRDAPRLVVVACFASHIHRVQQVCDAARRAGRKVAFLGRSMHQSTAAARELGYLDVPDSAVVLIEEVDRMDPAEVVVCSTGSQGEPLSALSLMAAREHKWVKLQPGDTVVLSSSVIPGNETAIHRTLDGLYRTGANVFHVPVSPVHVSGHAAAEELKTMLNVVRPRWFIPVHGELRHLAHHATLAAQVGVPEDHILICEDGDTVELGEQLRRGERVDAGMTFVDGLGIGDVGEVVLRDRRKLSEDGVVVVVVTVDAHTGEVLAGPDVINRGFVLDESAGPIVEEAAQRTVSALKEYAAEEVTDPAVLKQHIRKSLGKYFFEQTKRKPVIVPVIMEV